MRNCDPSSRIVYMHGTSAASLPPSNGTVLENNLAAMMKNGALLIVGPADPAQLPSNTEEEPERV